MSKPVLSICIPTFNRGRYVYDAALHILKSWNTEDIEVVVSDNHSNDDTEELMSRITDPRLKYYRNDRNLGAAFNTHLSFLRAEGLFAYLTSDEDDINIEEIEYLISYLRDHPETSVFIGGGNLTYTQKRFPDAVYTDPFEALKAIAFKTRYMTGIVLNQTLYSKLLSHISYEESASKWDAYSFMYAIAWLCCYGTTVTSSHILFTQSRFELTDISNNAREDGIYYYEPTGRINQMETWGRTIAELPINDFEKKYMVIKIIYDTIELATRVFQPGYVLEVKKTVRTSDFNVFQRRIAKLDKHALTQTIMQKGELLFETLFDHKIADCKEEALLAYDSLRRHEI